MGFGLFHITELTRQFIKMEMITSVHMGALSVNPFICSFYVWRWCYFS